MESLQDDPANLFSWLPSHQWGAKLSSSEESSAESSGRDRVGNRASTGFRLTISKWEVKKDFGGNASKGKEEDLSFDDIQRPPRLYRVKGVEDPFIRQVSVAPSSVNAGDAFVFDAERCLYLWMGG